MLGLPRIISARFNHLNRILVYLILLTVTFAWARSKEYQSSCELLVELTAKHEVAVREAAKWTCLAGFNAEYRTNYVDGDLFGLFGVKCNKESGIEKCNNTDCNLYLDDDISDDLKCARALYEIGYDANFYAHPKYNKSDCENNVNKIVVKCFGASDMSGNDNVIAIKEKVKPIVRPVTHNCTTNICDVMTSPSGQSLQTMFITILANLDSILYEPCDAVYALHKQRTISPRDIGAWACVIMDFVRCNQQNHREGEPDCKIGDCAKIESQYGITATKELCTEVIEAINDSYELLNETLTTEMLMTPDCLTWIPNTIARRCPTLILDEHVNQVDSEANTLNDEQLLFNNMLELLEKETRGFTIEDINKLEIISNSSYDPSTLDPCDNLIVHFNPNITSELSVSWLCFSRENVNCFRREKKPCFIPDCSTLVESDLKFDPNCNEHIKTVSKFIQINEEAILNTPERPLDDCRLDANLFLLDCHHHLSEQHRIASLQDITPAETNYGIYDHTSSYVTPYGAEPLDQDPVRPDEILIPVPVLPIDSNVIMSMGLSLQVNESHLMVQETFDQFLVDPCHVKTVLDQNPENGDDYIASMFCFAYDVLWCSSNEAPLKCNVDCKTVRDNIIQDDTKCIERLNQIILVGEKMQQILGLTKDEYSTNCMNSFIGFISSCRYIKDRNVNQDVPLYTRWPVRPTFQTRIERPSTERTEEASVSIFSGTNNNAENELMTIRITTSTEPSQNVSVSTEDVIDTDVDIPDTTTQVFDEPEQISTTPTTLLKTIENMTMDNNTFNTINACELYRNSSALETEFLNTFCAIYENAWCRMVNSEQECTVPCSLLNFNDDTELCDETLEIMYSISGMWTKIFMEEKLTFIPKCHKWARNGLERCDNENIGDTGTLPDLPVLAGAETPSDEELLTKRANTLAKERLCGIMRTFSDIYLVEEDQRPGWYCFAFDIFSCTIGRNRTVNCPVNCDNALDSFIKVDSNCQKRYRYVEEIAGTIDNKLMIDNHNIKPTDCRKDLRKILKVCDIVFEDYATTTTTTTTTTEKGTESTTIETKVEPVHEIAVSNSTIDDFVENFDQEPFENIKSLNSVTESEVIEDNTEINTLRSTESTTSTSPVPTKIVEKSIQKRNKVFDYQVFFPSMSCSNLIDLYNGISDDHEVIASYTCFYIDYIFCTVNDAKCAITCDSIEYDLIDRDACKSLLTSIASKMDQFSSIVRNLTHIADDCKPYYRKYLGDCDTEEGTQTTTEMSAQELSTSTSTTENFNAQEMSTTRKIEEVPTTTMKTTSEAPPKPTILATTENPKLDVTTSTYTTIKLNTKSTISTKHAETSHTTIKEDPSETSSSELISLRETLTNINPPSFDFTDSQQIEDDPIVCDKLYSLKAYLNIQPDVVISFYCFLQDYLLCKEQDKQCDLNCRNVDDEDVQETEACRKLVLSISRNRKHAIKYMDEGFIGSVEECKTRNSIACTELADKYYITSTTLRTTTQKEELNKKPYTIDGVSSRNSASTTVSSIETSHIKKQEPVTYEQKKTTVEASTQTSSTTTTPVERDTSTKKIQTTTTSTTTTSTETTHITYEEDLHESKEEPESLQSKTTDLKPFSKSKLFKTYKEDLLEPKEEPESLHPKKTDLKPFSDSNLLTDHLSFCQLKEIFVRQLQSTDSSVIVSYFCFMQDYVSCLNENEHCQLDCETINDETLRNTDLCRNAVTFVNEMRSEVPMIVTKRVDLAECKKSLRSMFDDCEVRSDQITTTEVLEEDFSTTTESNVHEIQTTIKSNAHEIQATTESPSESSTPTIETSSESSLIVNKNSFDMSSLADFFTIGIMHPKSMAKANFQIGLKEAQIKNIVITPDTDNSNFNVAFTFHVDEEELEEKKD